MKIAVITMWFNEEDLAPFFLNHYCREDIYLMLDGDTNDRTQEIVSKAPNVKLERFTFPDGMDDLLKTMRINQKMRELIGVYDWVLAVDADEFVFTRGRESLDVFLARQEGDGFNVVVAQMYQIYRHKTDGDLDPRFGIFQRKHGDPNLWENTNRLYCKPLCVKPSDNLNWGLGCHYIAGHVMLSPETLYGSHWAMAEPDIAVKRRIEGRMKRQSKRNLEMGMTTQHHHVTEEGIRAICKAHENDPDVLSHVLP